MPDFTHLHVHSQYSMLDGALKIKDICKKTKEYGMTSVAITDNHNMYGAIEFVKKAKAFGIKPIIGCELYVDIGEGRVHLPVLVKDKEGYLNLIKLLSEGQESINLSMLKRKARGLVVLTGCLGGLVAQTVLKKGIIEGKKILSELQSIIPEGNLFVELQNHNLPEQPILVNILVDMAKELSLPVVATNDCHYMTREDAFSQKMLGFIANNRQIDPDDFVCEEMYFKSQDEMNELFLDIPEAIANTQVIVNMCNLELELDKPRLPAFKENGLIVNEPTEYLAEITRKGLDVRFSEFEKTGKEIDKTVYKNRLEYEISMINKMGFAGYFLIVQDFVKWSKKNDIPVGPGRGSGAGSLVAYSLQITNLDPIEHSLLFERFLNPDRVSLPDFDIDFCKDRREEVMQYVRNKYGNESVGQIATFQLIKAKSGVKDVGRILGLPFAQTNKINSLMPPPVQGKTATILEALEKEPRLKELYDTDNETKRILDLGMSIEDLVRHSGVHAAGIVIADGKLDDNVPVTKIDGSYVTQYSKDDVESAGLVKFDFLGLNTLTIIHDAVNLIKQRPDGKGKNLDIDLIPYSLQEKNKIRRERVKKTFDLLSSGKTGNVFQIESDGMKKLFVGLKPDCLEDITAAVALYRPGPLGAGILNNFVARKHGREQITYDHPCLERILKPTYGIIVYQEQVRAIAVELAGYTLSGADLLRRAMGKKKPEEMKKQKDFFVNGAVGLGIDSTLAVSIFEKLEYFAGYGFNKSHAAAYGWISYQTAFLKTHFPTEFMAANLNSQLGKADKLNLTIAEAKSMGIEVLVPDINESVGDFKVVYKDGKEVIRVGFGGIMGIGDSSWREIATIRQQKPFKDMFDVANRCDSSKIKKTTYEALIESGAFDSTYPPGIDRSRAYYSIGSILEGNKAGAKASKKVLKGQISMFGDDVMHRKFEYADGVKWTEDEVFRREKLKIGLYITGHPLSKHSVALKMACRQTYLDYLKMDNGREIIFAGIISQLKIFTTKTGNLMAFLNIEDELGEFNCIVFNKVFEEVKVYITDNQIVFVKGRTKVERDDDDQIVERKIIVNEINEIGVLYENAKAKVDIYQERVNSIISKDSDDDGDYEDPF